VRLFRKSASLESSGFLDAGTHFTGELHFSGTLHLEGALHGSIITPDVLIIGEHATIHADIKAGEIHIHGTVSGNVDCERRVYIYSTGRLCGDVRTPRLVIEEGGTFEGVSRAATSSEDQLESAEAIPEQPRAEEQ
jgi:cytoskeletal protein CcmA (bactofilin family)